ncbi:hypothetical protein MFLAVUS_011258 [Mucor flavus]|uniref:Uncharacterized protein n=1 Tax=Mucor flavus TaxID=439312 RepID=A0ABP9ZF42_9FUNG
MYSNILVETRSHEFDRHGRHTELIFIMSNIALLNEYILKLIYDHLKLRDKFAFSLTIKKFHIIFSDYPLLDTIYEINQGEGCYENQFLFKNIANIRVVHALVDDNYIEKFLNLCHLDLSQVEFSCFNQVKTLIYHLPQKVLDITNLLFENL